MGSGPPALPVTETRWRTGGLTPFLSPRRPLPARPDALPPRHRDAAKAARIAALRQVMARLERAHPEQPAYLSLGVELHAHLPGPGLACGVLHEVAAAAHGDRPAAFGFVFALTAAALQARARPRRVRRLAARLWRISAAPYGHGLAQLGLDVGRLLLVETRTDKDALWAIEEALRSQARPAMVAGAIAGRPRPHHQPPAEPRRRRASPRRSSCCAPPTSRGTSAAATRWRIASAPAARDRFGAFAARAGAWRWSAAATDVPDSGLSSGIMSRIVSVWLRAWPIARLLSAQASAAPADSMPRHVRICAGRWCSLRPAKAGRASSRSTGPRSRAAWRGRAALQRPLQGRATCRSRDADPAADAAALRKLALWCLRYTPDRGAVGRGRRRRRPVPRHHRLRASVRRRGAAAGRSRRAPARLRARPAPGASPARPAPPGRSPATARSDAQIVPPGEREQAPCRPCRWPRLRSRPRTPGRSCAGWACAASAS